MDPDAQPMLPGLEPPAPGSTRLETAALATVRALQAEGVLRDRDSLTVALILDLAAGLAREPKGYARAQVAAQILAAIDRLPEPETTPDDEWDRLVDAVRMAGSGPAPRHPADA